MPNEPAEERDDETAAEQTQPDDDTVGTDPDMRGTEADPAELEPDIEPES